jgi:hypothetical protein
MLASGNEAANILAYNLSGGNIEAFIDKMNHKASAIGCINTNFTNAHGLLEPDNWSCAYDLALIAVYVYEKFELLREICVEYEYTMPGNIIINPNGYRVRNSNSLVRDEQDNIYFREFIRGVKSGALDEYFLMQAGEWVEYDGITNMVTIGEFDGRMYVIVTLEAPFKMGSLTGGDGVRLSRMHYAYQDHLRLYEWLQFH